MPDTLAAVDVGTNSLHLVVARTTEGDRFEVLTREKEMVRLGSGSSEMKELAPDAIDRAAAVPDKVGIELAPAGDELAIRLTPVAPVAGGGQVILARFLPHEQVTIESGENAGRVLDYVNIVSEWRDLGHWDGTGPAEIRTELTGEEPGAVLVQAVRGEALGPVLAAARLP